MNLSTLLVLCVLILIISFSVRTIIKDKKSGKSSGGDCGACGSHSLCHDSKSLFEEYRKQELHR